MFFVPATQGIALIKMLNQTEEKNKLIKKHDKTCRDKWQKVHRSAESQSSNKEKLST